MKKILIILAGCVLILTNMKDDSIVIPPDAIRFRVIASSNDLENQTIKNKLSKSLTKELVDLTNKSTSSKETKDILLKNEDNINNYITNFLVSNNVNYGYKLNIGRSYYPKKIYKGITYEAGYYDSVTVELGNHSGLNWWCVIYPPLCLIDEEVEDIEYTTLVKELLS